MPPRLSFDPNISEADLQQYYVPAFQAVVSAGAKSVMCAYNGINGYPSCMSPLIQQVLRGQVRIEPLDPYLIHTLVLPGKNRVVGSIFDAYTRSPR
jgi:hypothetical protein